MGPAQLVFLEDVLSERSRSRFMSDKYLNMNMYTTIIHMVHGCNKVMISLYVLHFSRARNILEKHKKFLVNMDFLK